MLTSKQRSILRSLGNDLEPILTIGKNKVTQPVIDQLEEALLARELVKARVLPNSGLDPKDVAFELGQATKAQVVQVIGGNILFYRKPLPGVIPKINV